MIEIRPKAIDVGSRGLVTLTDSFNGRDVKRSSIVQRVCYQEKQSYLIINIKGTYCRAYKIADHSLRYRGIPLGVQCDLVCHPPWRSGVRSLKFRLPHSPLDVSGLDLFFFCFALRFLPDWDSRATGKPSDTSLLETRLAAASAFSTCF